jgi:hypothetical protein
MFSTGKSTLTTSYSLRGEWDFAAGLKPRVFRFLATLMKIGLTRVGGKSDLRNNNFSLRVSLRCPAIRLSSSCGLRS